jgi:hypothetical protein
MDKLVQYARPSLEYILMDPLVQYTVKKVCHLPVPSRDVTDQTLPVRE